MVPRVQILGRQVKGAGDVVRLGLDVEGVPEVDDDDLLPAEIGRASCRERV